MAVPDTLRGFRTQFLYTLYRAIFDERYDYIYVPEGEEDVDIYCNEVLIETIQVKNLAKPVAYSDLISPGRTTSFFQRGEIFLTKSPEVKLKLVSFNGVSSELVNNDRLSKKIKSKNHVNYDRLSDVINAFSTESVDEDTLYDSITEKLKSQYPTFNPEKEIHYLLQWIYNLAERSSKFTLIDLNTQLISFREFESAQQCATAQLGIRVKRLFGDSQLRADEIQSLKSGFNKGISVTPKHIIAGTDLKRTKWLEQIEKAFRLHNTVIVHGASGQGKSALCYRYAHDYYAIAFEICSLTSNILPEIIATVKQISEGLKIPVLIYMDIKPGESEWINFIREFSEEKMIHLLISVREEDWNHNSAGAKHQTEFAEVLLSLSMEEAKEIHFQLCPMSSPKNFFDIWEDLGENAPLLEYVYYLNHQESLRSRLECQYQSLSMTQRKLLAQIIIPNYLGSSVSVSALPEMEAYDPFSTPLDLKYLENEYFRCIDDCLVDLHPIRTSILKDIITSDNFSVLQNIGCSWINIMSINDRQRYLINLLKEGVKPEKITQAIQKKSPIDSTLWHDVMMALLWQGCREYVDNNHANIDALRKKIGRAYQWFIPVNFTDIDVMESLRVIFKNNENLYDECCVLMTQMDNQQSVFKHIRKWIEEVSIEISPVTASDCKAFGEALYLLSLANLGTCITLPELKISTSIECDCESLAYLLLGLKSLCYLQSQWPQIERLFVEMARKQLNIYNLSISDTSVEARVFLNLCRSFDSYELKEEQRVRNASQFIHSKVLRVCEYFRMAFPDKLSYNSSIECGDITGSMFDTVKTISHANLPVRLMHIPRKFVCGICEQDFRTNSKQSYFEETITNRQILIRCCSSLSQFFKDRLSGANANKSLNRFIETLYYLNNLIPVELPGGMLDPLSPDEQNRYQESVEQIYKNIKTYSSEYDKYYNNLWSFLNSSSELLSLENSNNNRHKYLLFQALKNTCELKEQTLILGNPYLKAKELDDLCNKEEKVLKKLLQQYTFYCKNGKRIYPDSFINDIVSDNPEKLIKRYIAKLAKVFTEFGLSGNIHVEHNEMRITLIYRIFDIYPRLNELVRVILLSSLLSSDWPSSEQYLLESAIANIEITPLYEDENGKVINVSGITYNIPTSDIISLSESQNWELFLKMEKDKSYNYPEELRCLDSLKGILFAMLLMGSQTEHMLKEIRSDNRQGQVMLTQLFQSYRESIGPYNDILDKCKQVFNSEMLGNWIGTIESIYLVIEDECANDNWLKSTKAARDILNQLNGYDYLIRKQLVKSLGYEIDI